MKPDIGSPRRMSQEAIGTGWDDQSVGSLIRMIRLHREETAI